MNVLDLAIVLFVLSATVGGYRLGLLRRAASWVGLILGLFLATRVAPAVVESLGEQSSANKLLIAAAIFMGAAFVGQGAGLLLGLSFYRAIPPGPFRQFDRAGGAVAALAGVVAAIWLLLPSMAAVPGWPAQQARNSSIAQAIDRTLPNPPDTLQSLRRLIGPEAFPRVFDALRPAPGNLAPPPSSGITPAVADRVRASTVKVEGVACRRIQDGSGFSPAPDVVVTNAHVVAGERETFVLRPDGRRMRATVAVFDPDRDLAVLRVPGLGQSPLPIGTGRTGSTGAVFGHPNGQEAVAISPALIERQVEAVGRDLYDRKETRRSIFILASHLHPGDSGGALVNPAGAVMGVAFAIAPDRPSTAYALTSSELRHVLDLPRSGRANTGPCISS